VFLFFLSCSLFTSAQNLSEFENLLNDSHQQLLNEVSFYLDAYRFSENVSNISVEAKRLAKMAHDLRSVTVDVFDIDENAHSHFQWQMQIANALAREGECTNFALQQLAASEYADKLNEYRPKAYYSFVELDEILNAYASRSRIRSIRNLNAELEELVLQQRLRHQY